MTDELGGEALNEAVAWAARMQDPVFDDWDEHILWLEEDPSRAALYERAASALAAGLSTFDRHRSSWRPIAANDEASPRRPGWPRAGWWLGSAAAMAASIAAVFVSQPRRGVPDPIFRTSPGETRTVRLADGTAMTLNGDTLIRGQSSNDRHVALERGEVYLRVKHDPTRPFEIRVGNRTLRDVGTAFNVSVDPGVIRLAVAEGAVAVDPEQTNVRVDAGRQMTIIGFEARITKVPSLDVGTWRSGRLVYDDADLRQVASDVSRSLGVPVVIAPDVGSRRFTGALLIDAPKADVVRRLGGIVGVRAHRTRSGWILTSSLQTG